MKCQGWHLAWHKQEQEHTEFNLQELVLLPQGMSSCPPPPPPLLSKQWSQTVTAFSTQPWLWSSSTDCLYLKTSQEKKSHSVTAHTTFHSTWTMINSASLYWCAWLWNSNFLFFVCVCEWNSMQDKAAACGVQELHCSTFQNSAPARVPSGIWGLGLAAVTLPNMTWEKKGVQF